MASLVTSWLAVVQLACRGKWDRIRGAPDERSNKTVCWPVSSPFFYSLKSKTMLVHIEIRWEGGAGAAKTIAEECKNEKDSTMFCYLVSQSGSSIFLSHQIKTSYQSPTTNQPVVLFSHNKLAPATGSQTDTQNQQIPSHHNTSFRFIYYILNVANFHNTLQTSKTWQRLR